jgi:hypothetical protein
MNQFVWVLVIHFAPQPLNVDFDQIGEGIEVFIPNVFGNLCARNDFSSAARQIFQQSILFGRQRDVVARAFDLMRARVDVRSAITNNSGLSACPRRSSARTRASSS